MAQSGKKKDDREASQRNAGGGRRRSSFAGQKTKPVAAWREEAGRRLVRLENAFFRVEMWPEQGGAITAYIHKPSQIDIIWRNPYGQPARSRALDQPMARGSDLFDVMDGSWYVSLPNGFFADDYFGAPLGTHGELRAVPWTVEAIEQTAEHARVVLVGRSVRTPWVYRRELTATRGGPFLHWRETLSNRAREALPVAWLHHPTFGGALLPGARLVVPARTVRVAASDTPEALQLKAGYVGRWPQVPERQGRRRRDCSVVPAAESGVDHSVQLTDLKIGYGCIWNEGLSLGFALHWDAAVFPYAWSWASGGGIARYPLWGDGHLVTLQPSTSPVGRFADLVRSGEVLTVPGRGDVTTELRTGFVASLEDAR